MNMFKQGLLTLGCLFVLSTSAMEVGENGRLLQLKENAKQIIAIIQAQNDLPDLENTILSVIIDGFNQNHYTGIGHVDRAKAYIMQILNDNGLNGNIKAIIDTVFDDQLADRRPQQYASNSLRSHMDDFLGEHGFNDTQRRRIIETGEALINYSLSSLFTTNDVNQEGFPRGYEHITFNSNQARNNKREIRATSSTGNYAQVKKEALEKAQNEKTECPVCLGDNPVNDITSIKCKHVICSECKEGVKKSRNFPPYNCPVCREEMDFLE